MKKLFTLLLCCLLFTGCTGTAIETTTPSAETTIPAIETTIQLEPTEQEFWGLNIYTPTPEDWGSYSTFATIPIVINELSPEIVLDHLKEDSILNEDIEILSFTQEGSHLNIDFNKAFLDQLCSYGTTGEYVFMGCVVNTYLYVYNADTISITVAGDIMESGHVIYDFPMEFFDE